MPSNTDPNFDRLFLSNHSSTNSCVVETAQEMTRTSQNQREVIFDLPRPPYTRDRTASNNRPFYSHHGSEAEGDLVLIQTFLLYYVNQVILMLTSIFQEQFP